MAHVDATSRAPANEAANIMHKVIEKQLDVLIVRLQEEEVVVMQYNDFKLANLMKILKLLSEQRTKEQSNLIEPFILKNNMLYRVLRSSEGVDKVLWEVPNCMWKSIAVKNHDLAGHEIVDRTVAKIKRINIFQKCVVMCGIISVIVLNVYYIRFHVGKYQDSCTLLHRVGSRSKL